MKLRTKLMTGFIVIASILLSLAFITMELATQMAEANDRITDKQSALGEIGDLSLGLYQEQMLATKYISSNNPTEAETILDEKEVLGHDNHKLFDEIHEKHEHWEGHFAFEIIENHIETMDESFKGYVEFLALKVVNESIFANISGEIVNKSIAMKVNYFDNPEYTPALIEYLVFSAKNTTAQTLFQKMIYLEKEYLWQYKDRAHLDELEETVNDLKTIIPLTALPQVAKDDLSLLLGEYDTNINDIFQYIDEYDIDKLSALNAKWTRKVWLTRHGALREEWIDNPVYDGMFYIYRNYTVNGTIEKKSLDQLDNELGYHEKVVIFEDGGVKGQHYDQFVMAVAECKAYVNATSLNDVNKTVLNSVFDTYKRYMDNFLDNHAEYLLSLEKLEQEKTDLIAAMGQEMDKIMVGNSTSDETGLDYITSLIQGEIDDAKEEVDTAEAILLITMLAGIVLTIILSLLIGIIITRAISKPVLELTGAAEEIKNGNLEVHVRETGNDEITELAKTFNVMTLNLKHEIDQRNNMEENLCQTVVELKQSNAELEKFAYVASHDLQEPQRMIVSYLQLLENRYKDRLDPEANEFINYAVSGAIRMKLLINDLLEYSKVGSKDKALKPTALGTVIERTFNNLKVEIEENKAEVTHSSLPTLIVDENEFTQLFQNLVGNAIKFRGDKSPRIHISASHQEDDWLFSVKDNGIGIDSKYCDRIFQVFQRLHSKEEYSGTGIGLAICKKIIDRHGGHIWVESEPKKGSTFYFTLPVSGGVRK